MKNFIGRINWPLTVFVVVTILFFLVLISKTEPSQQTPATGGVEVMEIDSACWTKMSGCETCIWNSENGTQTCYNCTWN